MQVIDRLSAPATHIRDQTIARVRDALRPGQVCRRCKESTKEWSIGVSQMQGGRDVAPGDEQYVGWGARGDVTDGDDQLILVEQSRRPLPGRDPAEQAVWIAIRRHQITGLVLIRKPIVPTSAAIRYET